MTELAIALQCFNSALQIILVRMQKETDVQFQSEVQMWLDLIKPISNLIAKLEPKP